jgi:hypothetical protein
MRCELIIGTSFMLSTKINKLYIFWTVVTTKLFKQCPYRVVIHQGEIYLINATCLSFDSSDGREGSAAFRPYMNYPCDVWKGKYVIYMKHVMIGITMYFNCNSVIHHPYLLYISFPWFSVPMVNVLPSKKCIIIDMHLSYAGQEWWFECVGFCIFYIFQSVTSQSASYMTGIFLWVACAILTVLSGLEWFKSKMSIWMCTKFIQYTIQCSLWNIGIHIWNGKSVKWKFLRWYIAAYRYMNWKWLKWCLTSFALVIS